MKGRTASSPPRPNCGRGNPAVRCGTCGPDEAPQLVWRGCPRAALTNTPSRNALLSLAGRGSGRLCGLLNRLQGGPELPFVFVAKVRPEDGPAEGLDLLDDFVRRHLPDQDAQGRGAGLERVGKFV